MYQKVWLQHPLLIGKSSGQQCKTHFISFSLARHLHFQGKRMSDECPSGLVLLSSLFGLPPKHSALKSKDSTCNLKRQTQEHLIL